MKAINARESLTDREREEFAQEKEIAELQARYQLDFQEMQLNIQQQEMRWTQLFRLPFALLMVPVRIVFAIAYIAHAIRGTKPDDKFWNFLTKL